MDSDQFINNTKYVVHDMPLWLTLIFRLLSLFLMLASIAVAGLTWYSLPPGAYPVILCAIPAIPVILLAIFCFKKGGRISRGVDRKWK